MQTWQRNRKLTAEQVREIRRRVARGERHKAIAADYGVGRYCVRDIVEGRTWGWLDEEAA